MFLRRRCGQRAVVGLERVDMEQRANQFRRLPDQARAGLEQSMQTLKCDDPAVQQFERNLLRYFNKFHNL